MYPDILPGDSFALGTAVTMTTYQVALVVGFAGGGTVAGLFGVRPSLLADAATFAISALITFLWVRSRPAVRPLGSAVAPEGPATNSQAGLPGPSATPATPARAGTARVTGAGGAAARQRPRLTRSMPGHARRSGRATRVVHAARPGAVTAVPSHVRLVQPPALRTPMLLGRRPRSTTRRRASPPRLAHPSVEARWPPAQPTAYALARRSGGLTRLSTCWPGRHSCGRWPSPAAPRLCRSP
jgi:hypothetical protein